MSDSSSGDSPLDDVIDGGGRDVLAEGTPVAAEAWASHLLGMFDSFRLEARLARQEVPPFEEAVLERCAERRDERALAVATALAAVLPPPLDEVARAVAGGRRQSVPGPAWLDAIGGAEPTRSWVASDVFGDQDSLIIGFSQPTMAGEHAIVALVDHNLSGQAKDVWLAGDVDEVVVAWRSNDDRHMLEQVPVGVALARLRDAMATSDLWNGDTALRTEEFAENRALVWARLRGAGHGDDGYADRREVPQEDRDTLVAHFLHSVHGGAVRTEFATTSGYSPTTSSIFGLTTRAGRCAGARRARQSPRLGGGVWTCTTFDARDRVTQVEEGGWANDYRCTSGRLREEGKEERFYSETGSGFTHIGRGWRASISGNMSTSYI